MSSCVVTERDILSVVGPLVASASSRVWVTAPWVTTSAAELFFADLIARLRTGEQLDVRIVYRLKDADDLTISDLDALDRLAAAGCQVRYSNRLHAKVVLADERDAVVPSSNLTSTAGYTQERGTWPNEECDVLVELKGNLGVERLEQPGLRGVRTTYGSRIRGYPTRPCHAADSWTIT